MSSALRCLGNDLILQKILESCQLTNNLHLRLVNKTFNRECLRQIRLSHRKIELELYVSGRFRLNGCYFGFEKHRECFLFLTKTGRVRLEELHISVDGELGKDVKNTLHTNICNVLLKNQDQLRVLIGMGEICTNFVCEECRVNALKCREYGPAIAYSLQRTDDDSHQHFDKLIVPELVFVDIASACVSSHEENTTECFEMMKTLISSKISCDYLKVVINDDPECSIARYGTVENVIPREILEQMFITWKVKSIEVEMKRVPKEVGSRYWRSGRMFTEFEFFGPNEKSFVSKGVQFDSVTVNLLNARHAGRSVFDSHLMPNIRNLFPSKSYRILNQTTFEMTTQLFNSILQSVFRNQSINSAVSIRCNSTITYQSASFEVPPEFSHDGRAFSCCVSSATTDSVEHVAKLFTITDKVTRSLLNLEIVVDKKQLEMISFKAMQHGFLRYYL